VLLREETNPEQVKAQMQIDLAGEMIRSVFDVYYGDASGTGKVSVTRSLPSAFDRQRLEHLVRALVRAKRVEVAGDNGGRLRVFVNYPDALYDTPERDPRSAGVLPLTGQAVGADITRAVRGVAEAGRDLSLTFVADGSVDIRLEGVSLVLQTTYQEIAERPGGLT